MTSWTSGITIGGGGLILLLQVPFWVPIRSRVAKIPEKLDSRLWLRKKTYECGDVELKYGLITTALSQEGDWQISRIRSLVERGK